MKKKKRTPRSYRRVLYGVLLAVLIGAGAFIANRLGVQLHFMERQQVEAAYERWQDLDIDDYQITIYSMYAPEVKIYRLTVEHGIITHAEQQIRSESDFRPADPQYIQHYTIDNMFETVLRYLGDRPDIYFTAGTDLVYDYGFNSEWGFVENFIVDGCGRGDVQPPTIRCRGGDFIRDFVILAR